MIDSVQAQEEVAGFILENFLFGDKQRLPKNDASLIENGVVDSTGILELIDFLEKKYSISVDERETTPDNLDSIEKIVLFLKKKSAA
jgi:acyl carrier protein